MSWVTAVIVLAVVVAAHGLHRLAVWAEARGWIYYRTKRMPPGAAGLAAMEVAAILEPGISHVVDEVRSRQIEAEADQSGEGPKPGH